MIIKFLVIVLTLVALYMASQSRPDREMFIIIGVILLLAFTDEAYADPVQCQPTSSGYGQICRGMMISGQEFFLKISPHGHVMILYDRVGVPPIKVDCLPVHPTMQPCSITAGGKSL